MNRGDRLKRQSFSRFDRIARNKPPGAGASQEVLLVGGLFVGVAGGKHHALDAQLHHVVKEGAHALGIGPVKKRGVGGDPEAALQGFADGLHRDLVSALAAYGEVVVLLLSVQVHAEGQVLGGLEEMDLFLQQ